MQQSQPSAANHSNSPLVGSLSLSDSLLTRKRVSLILVGALLFAAAGAAIGNAQEISTKSQTIDVQKSSTTTEPAKSLNSDVSANGTDPPPAPQNQDQTSVNVNGQNIPVPSQGSTSKTIKSKDGQTTVNVSHSSSSSQSSTGASSYDNFNLNVTSRSESSSDSSN